LPEAALVVDFVLGVIPSLNADSLTAAGCTGVVAGFVLLLFAVLT
jgi:hypothetical protein